MQRYPIILVFFFFSGASALVYEIVWVRQLTLVFGNTVQATATVLAAFMGGLAAGAYALGRWLDRTEHDPLRVYAMLEFGIAASALVFPLYLSALPPIYRPLYGASGGGALLVVVRFAACSVFLGLPTALMGGTLPALAKRVVAGPREVAVKLGTLYAINTFGGVAGTAACGFWLIPTFGIQGTTGLAVGLNVAVGALAWRLAGDTARSVLPEATRKARPLPLHGSQRVVLLAYFTSGFCALALEVIWTRVLLLVLGSSTYAFTVMLATFLSGIAVGSALSRRWVGKAGNLEAWLGVVLSVCGLAAAVMASVVNSLPRIYLEQLLRVGINWTGDIAARVVVSAALMILPTLLFGSTFPLVVALEANRLDTLGRRLGTVYAANTLGAIGGSLVGGFVLLPWLGMQRSQQALAVLLVLVGAAVLLGAGQWTPRARWASAAGLFAGTILAVSASEPWNQKLLSLGVFFTPQAYITPDKRLTLAKALGQDRLLYYREGRTATVAVLLREGTHKSFRVDGKPEMSTLPDDLRLGRMMGHLPMLLHPKPRVVLNIGLGAGMTVAAVAAHPAEQIDVAEIEPLVSNAARLFAEENHHVLDDRRVHLIFNDGRNHLLLTDRRYDVITSDPIEPSVAGAASLFTVDHFRIARSRLAPGGIMCQFLPLYELEPREYQSILRSFAAAFPHVTVWWTGDDTFLIGSEEPITIDFARLATQVQDPSVRNDLDDVGLADPYRLLATFLFALKPGDPPTTDAPLNTDNHPYVEFTAPKRRWMPTVKANHEELLRRKSSLPDTVRFPSEDSAARAAQFFKAQQLAMQALIEKANKDSASALALARQARALDPSNPWAGDIIAGWHMEQAARLAKTDDPEQCMQHILQALEINPRSLTSWFALVAESARQGHWNQARAHVQRALEVFPDSPYLRHSEAVLRESEGEVERQVGALLRDYPAFAPALVSMAEIEIAQKKYSIAGPRLARAVEQDETNEKAHFVYARLAALTGRPELAREHLSLALHYGGASYKRMAEQDPALRSMRP